MSADVRSSCTIPAAMLWGMEGSEADRRDAFARVLAARRAMLGLTQRDVYAAGGPTPATQVRWERGYDPDIPAPRDAAINRIDGPLRWQPGTALKLYNGEINEADALHRSPTNDDASSEQAIFEALDVSYAVRNQVGLIYSYISNTVDLGDINPEVAADGRRLKDELLELYATLVLQEYAGPGRSLSENLGGMVPFIDKAMESPEPEIGTPEHHRWAYRRWLVGKPYAGNGEEDAFRRYWESVNYRRI